MNLLSLIFMIFSVHAQDFQYGDAADPNYGMERADQQPLQAVQLSVNQPSFLSQATPFIIVGIATPALAYLGVKIGGSVWIQSTGIAQTINVALTSFIGYYPKAPRNIMALLASWGFCATLGLIKASGLTLAISFKENSR
ncbi:MAG: hypothetical protein KF798_02275 [Candidatus Paracaedibacteraceae bacterium]|nr:hypothetical protein [Candidatus Paracaedibacteraceae bacterium]